MMNKLFKGAVAGAAGVALLLGGAGTFALWNQGTSIGADEQIASGYLQFEDVPDGTWTLNNAPVLDNDPSNVLIVPGDTLVYSVNGVEVKATGTNLLATFGVNTDGMAPSALASALQQTITVDDQPVSTITLDPGVTTHNVVVTFVFDPNTEGVTAQGATVDLNDVQLTLQQQTAAGQVAPTPTATP